MAFIFDALATMAASTGGAPYMMGSTVVPIVGEATGAAAAGAGSIAGGAVNAATSAAATAGTAALLTDKPELNVPQVKGAGKPVAPPGAPISPSDTAALQRARNRPMAKTTILTKSRSRTSNPGTISRATLSSGGE